jgi:YebC/PmpR family DNA-binding regulatory protein
MSGHSKWSTIKRKKGAADAKRGKLFTKLIREVSVAARAGGGDPDTNPRLRAAVQTAKAANMPSTNIDRAIAKATGDGDGAAFEEISYEGYGPNGVAIFIECLTDNRNRTGPEVRHVMSKRGGNLGKAGCAANAFTRRGRITVASEGLDEDDVFEAALEAGAEEMENVDSEFEILTAPDELDAVRRSLEEQGLPVGEVGLTMVPDIEVPLSGNDADKALALIEAIEDIDDVQNVYANFDISDEEMNRIAEGS